MRSNIRYAFPTDWKRRPKIRPLRKRPKNDRNRNTAGDKKTFSGLCGGTARFCIIQWRAVPLSYPGGRGNPAIHMGRDHRRASDQTLQKTRSEPAFRKATGPGASCCRNCRQTAIPWRSRNRQWNMQNPSDTSTTAGMRRTT